jgi:hypothetical protein
MMLDGSHKIMHRYEDDTDDRRSGAPAIWGKVKIFKSKNNILVIAVYQ